ncbi:Stromal membrane-associated protein 1 [Myotis brandtii]|uniref:Stromal membrane-associated protein 1 n=1 Tax=Myotis brandtii TaxID=109478 RepID=S7N900_MYOBR|nr:Stromal membrane-associated protein 1 [Myotis brandtii]
MEKPLGDWDLQLPLAPPDSAKRSSLAAGASGADASSRREAEERRLKAAPAAAARAVKAALAAASRAEKAALVGAVRAVKAAPAGVARSLMAAPAGAARAVKAALAGAKAWVPGAGGKPVPAARLQKKEDQQLEPKKSTSPKKAAEPTVDLLGLDGPAEAPVTNGNTTTVPALNDDLDIFGPMISNPLPATVMPPAQGTSSVPAAATVSTVTSGDLDLFTEQTTKSEEVTKKQLSKDSILSLYGAGTVQPQSAPGVFMGPTNIPFTSQAPTAFQGFPSMGVPVPAAPGLMGNVMGQSASMMVGMPIPNGFMGNAQTGVMPLPQNVIAPQGGMVGQMGAPPSKFGLPQAQQPPWNLSQVNQQMAGMSMGSASPALGFAQPPSTTAGWSGSSSGQTLSTQLWK